jgi:hypothetical protein
MIANSEYWQEYYRVIGILYATEDGLYRELPESEPSHIIVEVVYRICMVDRSGRLRIQDFDNPPGADKDDNLGGIITLDGRPWYIQEPDKGHFTLACYTYYSPIVQADASLASLAATMHSKAKLNDAFLP